jgi:hypothetical protein
MEKVRNLLGIKDDSPPSGPCRISGCISAQHDIYLGMYHDVCMFAIPDTDPCLSVQCCAFAGSFAWLFTKWRFWSLSIFNQSGIIQLQRYSGNGIWVIMVVATALVIVLASYAFSVIFNQEILIFPIT